MRKMALVTGGGVVGLLVHMWVVYSMFTAGNVVGSFIAIAFGCMILGGTVGLVTRRTAMAVVMIFCGFLGSFFTAYELDSLTDLDTQMRPSNVVHDVPVDGFGDEPAGRVVYLRESYVLAELIGGVEHQRTQGRGLVQYRVAPIAAPGWTKADPVIAWAAFRTNDNIIGGFTESDGLAEWAKPNRAGFVVDREILKFQEAIADAELQHGLHSARDAPLLDWRSPEAERRDRRNRTMLALFATLAAWLASTLGGWQAAHRARKSSTASA